MILFFDIETTGKADFRAAPNAAHQPRLVQLAMIATSDDGARAFHEASFIIKPEGFVIPEEAAAIHGITQEIAMEVGIPLIVAMSVFKALANNSRLMVAYNSDFDSLIMKRELYALGKADRIEELFKAQMHCA